MFEWSVEVYYFGLFILSALLISAGFVGAVIFFFSDDDETDQRAGME